MRSGAKRTRITTVGASEAIVGMRRARIVALDEAGSVFVSVDGDGRALQAVLGVPIARAALRAALDQRRELFVMFENGEPERPVVVGYVQPPDTPAVPG